MKLNMKMLALAAALAATGAVKAETTAWNQATGGSLIVYAYDTITNGYYIRDLGVLINSFLPSSIGPVAGDNPNAGDKTPEAGLNLVFATDATFTSWAAGLTSIKWGVAAGEGLSAGLNGVSRMIFASDVNPSVTNAQLTTAVGATGLGGINNLIGSGTGLSSLSAAAGVPSSLSGNGGIGNTTLTDLGSTANLYYYTRTAQSTGAATQANETVYGNSLNLATITMALDGTVTYDLQPAAVAAVPLPAAVWMLGAGLLSLGGMARRRKAAVQA